MKTMPDKEGWYWCRSRYTPGNEWNMVKVTAEGGAMWLSDGEALRHTVPDGCEWVGPLTPPRMCPHCRDLMVSIPACPSCRASFWPASAFDSTAGAVDEIREALEFIAKQEDKAGNWAVELARKTLREVRSEGR